MALDFKGKFEGRTLAAIYAAHAGNMCPDGWVNRRAITAT